MVRSFSPAQANTLNIDVSATSQRVLVGNCNAPMTIRVMNNGTATVWLNWGDVTVTATTTAGLPIGPGVHEVLTLSPDQGGLLYIAAIAAGVSGRIYFTQGAGI
ncbi:hypothetical protein UFOVP749_13 [uncultured Caudovirales phage]|uniref:Uncharacterized protein n=1 Tax=uncultured Caudovirales phage TaxID=2100421 RepID=A0A6J7X382_9CAUD|nr:hypothetical protein UFOVP749_13 [uncultured Caudovirales phage]